MRGWIEANLCHDHGPDEYEEHLGVHGIVPSVLDVHCLVLPPPLRFLCRLESLVTA